MPDQPDQPQPPDQPQQTPEPEPHTASAAQPPSAQPGPPEAPAEPPAAPERVEPPAEPVQPADQEDRPDRPAPHPVLRALRAATALAGVGIIGYGMYGLLHDSYITDPIDVLWWAVGGLILHDGLWLPIVCLLGLTLTRSTPVRTGLIVAAAVTAVALPAVLRAGVNHGNPSVLALPYLRNWLLTLATIAILTTVWALLRRHRRRH